MKNCSGVSITAVVTTYNRPRLVKRAIRTVLDQTYTPAEIIVVEDGTDSGVEAWLGEENHDTVQYVRHDHNKGLAAARNTALEQASGDYVAYLDDDDQWKPDRLKKQVALLRNLSREERERTGVIYSLHETKYPDGTVVSSDEDCNEGLLRESITQQGELTTPPSSFLFKTAALREIGGFDEQLQSSIDHDIWMALANAYYHAYYVDEPLVVNSKEGHESMVTDGSHRVQGVLQFTEKWRPVFKEWMGNRQGERFVGRYLARVLAQLSGEKMGNGKWKEAIQVSLESFEHRVPFFYNSMIQADRLFRGIARRTLSRPVREKIRKIVKK